MIYGNTNYINVDEIPYPINLKMLKMFKALFTKKLTSFPNII